jgi:hypothetical protein
LGSVRAGGFDQAAPERLFCARDKTGARGMIRNGLALAGKQSVRFKSKLRLLIQD